MGSFGEISGIGPGRAGRVPVGTWKFPETYPCCISFESGYEVDYHAENCLKNGLMHRDLWSKTFQSLLFNLTRTSFPHKNRYTEPFFKWFSALHSVFHWLSNGIQHYRYLYQMVTHPIGIAAHMGQVNISTKTYYVIYQMKALIELRNILKTT